MIAVRPVAAPRVQSAAPRPVRAAAPARGPAAAAVTYEHVEKKPWWAFWMFWRKEVVHRHAERAARLTVLADTPENRARALALAAADGRQSVVARRGGDVLVLAGGDLTARGRTALSGVGGSLGIGQGAAIAIDGQAAEVLARDDGFDEVDASGVIVAVLDTGVDASHPALAGRVLPGIDIATGKPVVSDGAGHGTHVAGIIAAAADGPMRGVAPTAKILPVRVLGTGGNANLTIARGIRWAADHGAHVINMSFFIKKGEAGYAEVMKALDYAASKDVVLVKSAGNTGKEGLTSPAEHPAIITVGSLNAEEAEDHHKRSGFSSFGDRLDLSAPGGKVLSLKKGGGYTQMSGTSMAAPHVAGLAALVRAQHPDWSAAQVKAHLLATTDDVDAPGRDKYTGAGVVDAFRAAFGA